MTDLSLVSCPRCYAVFYKTRHFMVGETSRCDEERKQEKKNESDKFYEYFNKKKRKEKKNFPDTTGNGTC